jgi:hypothetical protein
MKVSGGFTNLRPLFLFRIFFLIELKMLLSLSMRNDDWLPSMHIWGLLHHPISRGRPRKRTDRRKRNAP